MKLNAYALYDKAIDTYLTPFFLHNDELARRAIEASMVQEPDGDLIRYPEQFTLLHVGTFDDKTGVFSPEDRLLCNCTGFAQRVRKHRLDAIESVLDELQGLLKAEKQEGRE